MLSARHMNLRLCANDLSCGLGFVIDKNRPFLAHDVPVEPMLTRSLLAARSPPSY
jgi:hypothetical protein